MVKIVPRHPYDGTRVRPQIKCGKGRTKQSFKDECDIHRILSSYARTGLLTHVAARPGYYADVADMPDYRSALDAVKSAEGLFMALPAVTRSRFENDPAKFLDFCSDSENEAELRELGLLPPEGAPEVVPEAVAPVVDPVVPDPVDS